MRRVRLLVFAVTLFVFTGVGGGLYLLNRPVRAAAGINETVNFQGRLLNAAGAVVADGTYNMRFKVYCGGDGVLGTVTDADCTHATNEDLLWTETRESTDKVQVKNGYFSVYLGSVTAFGSNVDWNQDELYLSIDIGGTGSPSYDGEMSPFTRLGATPYALNSKYLGGLQSGNFVQLAQGVQTDGSSTNASIAVNKTAGTADILKLQKSGTDVFLLSNTGTLLLQNATDSATALQVMDQDGGTAVLTVDTVDERVGIGATPANGLLTVGTNTTVANGGMYFGTDVSLYRSAADTLRTDDAFISATSISSPQTGTNSEAFGASATVAGQTNSVALGASASSTASNSTIIGRSAADNGYAGSTVVGYAADSAGTNSFALGRAAIAAQQAIAIGYGANAASSNSIALMRDATTTASNQLVIGSTTYYADDVYIGSGVTSTTPRDIVYNATGGSGTDRVGANITVAGGKGTGTGTGGHIYFKTAPAGASGSSLNSLVTLMEIAETTVLINPGKIAANDLQVNGDTVDNLLFVDASADKVGIGNATPINALLTIGTDTITSSGGMYFGTDTNLYRSAANTLMTDDALTVGGVITASTLGAADTDSYAVCRDTSTNQLTACDSVNTTGRAILQGGNTLGTGMIIGPQDGQPFYVKTNNITRITITAGGATTITGGVGSVDALTINNQTSTGNIFVAQDNGTPVLTIADGGAATFKNETNSTAAFQVQDTAAANLIAVDTAARGVGGGNLVKIGNSTGTDTATTILQLDTTTVDPTSNLGALNGGLFYNSTLNKVSIIENGVVKVLCNTIDAGCGAGGSGARLDQVTAATSGASINNAANNMVWNWQLTAAESGFSFTENTASTGGGTQDQFIFDAATLSGSTASPLRITSASVDAADIVFNLANAGDLEFQDNGTAFMTLSDAGAYTYTLDGTDNPAYTITNNGSGNVVTNLASTGDFIVQDNGTAVFTVSDTGVVSTNYASTSTSAASEGSMTVTVADTGVVTTGTDTTIGQFIDVTRTGATGGTINTYGQFIDLDVDDAGAGTHTATGVSVSTASKQADNNYGYVSSWLFGGTSAALTEAIGFKSDTDTSSLTGSFSRVYGFQADINATGGGTFTEASGLIVQSANVGGGGVITANYGVLVKSQSAGVANYGIAVEAADTQTLWLSSNANNTTASAGIAFGSSRDTTLYRSGVATLATDGTLKVGSTTSAGGIDLYGEITRKGITQQTGLTGINDVFIYDITADSDGGAWADSEASQGLSWYGETKDDGFGDSCNIASDDRCGDSRFPRKAIVAATDDAVYVFDAVSQKMFMKFTQAGTYSLGADTNNDPSSVFALNGVLYVGTNGSSASGMYAIDFAHDRLYNYNTTDRDQGDKNISNRNTAVTYATDSRTAMAIRHNAVNAVHGAVLYGSSSIETNGGPLNGATFIAAATDDSMSVVNLSAQQTLDYGDNLTDQFSSVFVTRRGRLYGLNVTLGQLERYGTQANGTVGIDVAKADQATPTDVYDEQAANLPNLSKTTPTFTVGAPDALKVLERGSLADDAADRIYVGHSQGMTEIHDVNAPSATVIGWSQFVKQDGTTMHMSGNAKGAFRFDETTGDLTDDTRAASILEPEVAPTYGVPGVRGTALRFDGTSQFLCSDANNDGTCDTDADFNVAAISSHIKVWFKHSTTITGTDVLVDRRYTAFAGAEGIGYTIEMNSSGQMVYGIQDTAATAGYDDSVTSTQSYNDNQWHYLVAVNTDTGICLFIDGKLTVACDTALAATGTLDASQILTIGADASGAAGGNFWDGDIDDVYFAGGGSTTSSNQTQAQIRKQYLAGRSALARPSTRVTDATAVSSTTIGDSGETYVPNSFVGSFVEITGGTGAGQTRRIVSNDGTTFTVSPAWTTSPDTTSDFEVMPEQLYGSTDTVTSIGMSDANAFIGTSRNLYIGTNDGAGGGGVTVFGGYGNEYVTDMYHSDAGVTDSLGNAWSGANADDIGAIEGDNGNLVFGSGANLWREKFDRNILQELDSIIGNLGSVRAELIVDGLLGTSTETGNIGGADLAERYTSTEGLEPGDIVSMEGNAPGAVMKSSGPYDKKALGIVATEPGIIIGPREDSSYPIALSGRVPVKVILREGQTIKSGDRITTSELAGYGMKAIQAGRVIGTALEDVDPTLFTECSEGAPEGVTCGTVMVFVNLVDFGGESIEVAVEDFENSGMTLPESVFDPLMSLGDAALSEKLQQSDRLIRYLLGRKQQLNEQPQSEVLTDRLSAFDINGVSIVAKDIVAGTITADKIKANQIEGLELLVDRISARPEKPASTDEEAVATESTENKTTLLDNITFNSGLVAEDFTVKGTLFASGALKVAGPVDFLGDSIFHRLATFVDKVIFKEDVTFEGRVGFNQDTAGFATIYKTQKKVEVEFEEAYAEAPVVTVTVKNGKFAQYAYDDLTEEGFTIILPEAATEDLEFAWTAISVKDAKTVDVPVLPENN